VGALHVIDIASTNIFFYSGRRFKIKKMGYGKPELIPGAHALNRF
jgi:hypothetical protein